MKFVKPYYPLIILGLASFNLMGLSKAVKEDEDDRSSPAPHVMRAADWNEQQAAEWDKAKQEIMANISNMAKIEPDHPGQTCRLNWEITWALAKRGNLEARYTILNAFRNNAFLWLGNDVLAIVSLKNIRTYLYYHSLGAPRLTAEIATMRERIKRDAGAIDNYPEQLATADDPRGRNCVWENPSQACTELVKFSLPTFDSLSKQIDMLIAGGVRMPCINTDR